jgi:hypothetical protein
VGSATKRERSRPTPEGRRRGVFPAGEPVTLSDGVVWTLPLAIQAPSLREIRDKLFDEQQMSGLVSLGDVIEAAYTLLYLAYDLDSDEIIELLRDVDGTILADAVMSCVLGVETGHRTYGDWVESALLANGIDPKRIPPHALANVLRHLVKTGRAEEASSFISSMEASSQRTRLMESFGIFR